MPSYPDLCPICGKPVPNSEANLKVFRAYVLSGIVVGGGVGVALLPLAGFGLGGIVAGSIAASWQSAIGAVTTGSVFATLQSLGATGLGMLLFGTAGAGIGILTTYARKFGFCVCHQASTDATSGHS